MEIPFPHFGNGNETLLFPGKVGNFFGLSVCHCCHFVLRMQFLSGAGLAKMLALAPVAERSQPVNAVPLCQSAVTGKF